MVIFMGGLMDGEFHDDFMVIFMGGLMDGDFHGDFHGGFVVISW